MVVYFTNNFRYLKNGGFPVPYEVVFGFFGTGDSLYIRLTYS